LRYDEFVTPLCCPRRREATLAEHFRRIDPRYDRQLSVEMSCEGEEQIGRSRNLSLGGMYWEGRKALPIGMAVSLRFHIPTQPEAVEVTGDVRWVVTTPESSDIGIGIRFQGLRARDVWALNRFFQSAS
jgi:uncharacterized protein (TIGR02266 family)